MIAVLTLAIIVISQRNQHQQRFDQAEAHLRTHQHLLADAVNQAKAITAQPRGFIPIDQLPGALVVPGLLYAQQRESHINLVLHTSPDTVSGFRVWESASTSDYADTPTSIPNVYRFTYCDDYPDSSSNRP